MKSIKDLSSSTIDIKKMKAIKGGKIYSISGTVKGGGSRPIRPSSLVFKS